MPSSCTAMRSSSSRFSRAIILIRKTVPVSSASAMKHYAFIWIPVGLLICITVIAFNFVGDGLRDAYDPKAKR